MARDNKHIKGDRAELIAQEFFIKKGFYVFNVDLETREVMEDVPTRKNYKNNVINIKEYMEIFTPE